MSETGIGVPVKRVEDRRFLTGRGNYTDDINQPGQLYAWILKGTPCGRSGCHCYCRNKSASPRWI